MRKSILTAAVLAVLSFSSANAAEDASKTNLPTALKAPLAAGFSVEKSFIAASGLTGWVLQSPSGEYNVFYTTADGQSMIAACQDSSSSPVRLLPGMISSGTLARDVSASFACGP